MKRGASEPLINEIAFCAATGWTPTELRSQDTRDVELMEIYLDTIGDIQLRQKRDAEREMRDRLRSFRL